MVDASALCLPRASWLSGLCWLILSAQEKILTPDYFLTVRTFQRWHLNHQIGQLAARQVLLWPMRGSYSHYPFPSVSSNKNWPNSLAETLRNMTQGWAARSMERRKSLWPTNYPSACLMVYRGWQGRGQVSDACPSLPPPGDTCLNPFPVSHLHWLTSSTV